MGHLIDFGGHPLVPLKNEGFSELTYLNYLIKLVYGCLCSLFSK